MYYVFFGGSPPPPVAEAACDVVPDLAAYALAPLSLGAALAGVAAVLALRWVYAKARAAFADACGRCFDEVDADGSGAVDGDELYVAVLLSYLALNRGAPRASIGLQCSNVLTRALAPCFENSTRAIGSSKNQPNRLRFGRAGEFQSSAPTSRLTGRFPRRRHAPRRRREAAAARRRRRHARGDGLRGALAGPVPGHDADVGQGRRDPPRGDGLRRARLPLRGTQIFNPTAMCAYSNDSTHPLCFKNSTRAIDSSKSQPNRLRCGRARECQSLVGTSQTGG
jgi:hypothetical protein